MTKRKSKTLRFYPSELTCTIEVASDACQEIYRLLDSTLFEEFKTSAILTRGYASEHCAHFKVKVGPGDQEKLKNLISKFCREQKLVLLQGAKQ